MAWGMRIIQFRTKLRLLPADVGVEGVNLRVSWGSFLLPLLLWKLAKLITVNSLDEGAPSGRLAVHSRGLFHLARLAPLSPSSLIRPRGYARRAESLSLYQSRGAMLAPTTGERPCFQPAVSFINGLTTGRSVYCVKVRDTAPIKLLLRAK